MGRPTEDPKFSRVSIRLNSVIMDRIKEIARLRRVPYSELVRDVLYSHFATDAVKNSAKLSDSR